MFSVSYHVAPLHFLDRKASAGDGDGQGTWVPFDLGFTDYGPQRTAYI